MTEVGPDDVLHQYRSPGQVTVIGAEAQEAAHIPLGTVELLAVHERVALRSTGEPAWFAPEPVRDDLRLLRVRVGAADLVAVEKAIDLVEHACATGTGVAVVPPAVTT